jgi:Tfp pilus assembly PilM family ATPase/Tfp pilus assembly protein PilN
MPGINMPKFNLFSAIANLDLVGIDLSTANLKVCHVRGSPGKKELVSAVIRNTNGLSEDEIAKALLVLTREFKIKNPHYVLCVPSQLVITKNIEVPSLDQREIREIVNLQAGRHTPYSREEVIVDYIPIGTYKQNYTKVLLLIVNSSVVKKQFAVLDKAGIKIDKAVLAQEGLGAFAAKSFKFDPASVTALVHVDDAVTDFSILFKNKVIFIRSISIGRQHLTGDREKASEKFLDEVKKSLDSYQVENVEKTPAMLVLTGAIDGVDSLDTLINEAVHIPVRAVPYLPLIPKAFKSFAPPAEAQGVSFLNVVASLQALGECRTSFIPEEVKLKAALAQRGRDLMVTAVAFLTIAVLFFMMMMTQVYFKNAYLKKLEEKYRNLGGEAKKLEKDFQKNNLVRSYLLGRGSSVNALTQLYDFAPLNLNLNYIKFENGGKYIIRGTAESMSVVFSFNGSLEKSKAFKEVKIKYTTKRVEGQKDLVDFEINCLISKAAS